jgi:hypothetical protein
MSHLVTKEWIYKKNKTHTPCITERNVSKKGNMVNIINNVTH